MHEEKFWETLIKSADVWSVLVLVIIVSLIIFAVLRVMTGAVADRRTRRILLESMRDDAAPHDGQARIQKAAPRDPAEPGEDRPPADRPPPDNGNGSQGPTEDDPESRSR